MGPAVVMMLPKARLVSGVQRILQHIDWGDDVAGIEKKNGD